MTVSRASPLERIVSAVAALEVVELGVQQQLRHADDAVHGRPDLVAHVGQEVALGAGGRQRLVAGASQVLFGPLPGRDVIDQGDEVDRLAGPVPHQRDAQDDPDDLAVLVDVPLFHLERCDPSVEHSAGLQEVGLEVVGVGELLEGRGQQLFLGVADDFAQRAVDPDESAVGGDQRHADGRCVKGTSEPLLAQPQGLGGPLLFGDRSAFGDEKDDPARLIVHRLEGEIDRHDFAIGSTVIRLVAYEAALGRILDGPPEPLAGLLAVGPQGRVPDRHSDDILA